MPDLTERHFQGVAAEALQELLVTHLLIAVPRHRQQVEGSGMVRLTLLLYHQDRRVKSFMNIEMLIRRENECEHRPGAECTTSEK